MKRVYPIRGRVPVTVGRPVGFRPDPALGKQRNPFRLTIGGLDHQYTSFGNGNANVEKQRKAFLRKITQLRAIGYELPEDFLQRRYPRVFEIHPVDLEIAVADTTAREAKAAGPREAIVPFPSERICPSCDIVYASREGQAAFRESVLAAYGCRCAVTGCTVERALDAAHIIPYVDRRSHLVVNGICFRTDVHRLFDSGLIEVTPDYEIRVSSALETSDYFRFQGTSLNVPAEEQLQPSRHLLSVRHRFVEFANELQK